MSEHVTPREWLERSPARKRLLCYWTLLHFLPGRGQAVLVDTQNNMVQQLARERGYDCLRLPSTSALDRHGAWIEPWLKARNAQDLVAPTDVYPVLLGARQQMLEYRPPTQPGLRHTPPNPVRLPVTTLDALLHALNNPAFIHINDASNLAGMLVGGMKGLALTYPVLSFVLPYHLDTDLRAALTHLQKVGYRLFDTGFQPWHIGELPGERECIALPPDYANTLPSLCRRTMLWGELGAPSGNGHDSHPLEEQVMPIRGGHPRDVDFQLLTTSGVSSGLLREGLTSRRVLFGLDWLPGDNWYPMEKDGGYHWRWSGPGTDARLLLPVPAPGHYTLSCKVMNTVTPDLAGRAQIFVDGVHHREIGRQFIQDTTVHVGLHIRQEEWNGALELMIALPRTARPSESDPRKLGLSLDWLSLQWRELE